MYVMDQNYVKLHYKLELIRKIQILKFMIDEFFEILNVSKCFEQISLMETSIMIENYYYN